MVTKEVERIQRFVRSNKHVRKINYEEYYRAYHATSLAKAVNILCKADPQVTRPYLPNKASQAKFIETTSDYTLNRTRSNRIVMGKKGYWYA